MLSQGHMGAPLYHSIGQVGPRFVGNLGSPMWSENDVSTSWLRLLSALQITSYIRIRHIQSVLAIGMLSQGYIWVHSYAITLAKLFWKSGSLVE